MTRERIYLFLIIIVLLFFPLYLATRMIITKQNEEETEVIRSYYSKGKGAKYDEMKKILGEPNYVFQKEDYPFVEYKKGKVSNQGFVAVWDTNNWYGRGYIIISSFDRNTQKQVTAANFW